MATLYWVGGSATWDATAGTKWAATSGGAGGQPVPTAADDVVFDAASGSVTITVSGSRVAKSLDASAFTGTLAGTATPLLALSGNLIIGAGMTYHPTLGPTVITINATGSVTTNGKTIRGLTINAPGAVVTLLDNLTCAGLTVTAGTFDANDFNITCTNFNSSNSNTRVVNCGNGTWTLTNSGTIFDASTSTGLTFNAEGSTFVNNNAGAIAMTGAVTFNNLDISGGATSPNLTLTNISFAGTFTLTAPRKLGLASNLTGTGSANFVFSGYSVAAPLMVQSTTVGTARTITMPVGSTTIFPAGAIRDITGAGGTFAANDNYNIGQNSGITFNPPASAASSMTQPINSNRLVA